jgi:hypothetical protein
MNGVTKKKQTHKAKSVESIWLQQNHRSKNIIICQKITKQSKQNSLHITRNIFFEIHHKTENCWIKFINLAVKIKH